MRSRELYDEAARRLLAVCGILLAITFSAGCEFSEGGPERYPLSGKVTFAGQPVPHGEIVFEPDNGKGNSGPAVVAIIKNGVYSTPDGNGTIGGAMIVRISGLDGKVPANKGAAAMSPHGMMLFLPYTTAIELPKETTKQDFEVPVELSPVVAEGEVPKK